MRTTSLKAMLFAATAALLAGPAGATDLDPANWTLLGEFQIRPTSYHRGVISGGLAITRNETRGANLEMKLDAPVLDKLAFPSSEAWATRIGVAATERTVVAFKLKGPPHRWYFVVVASTFDGGLTLNGPIYKAPGALVEIQAAVPALATTVPSTWKQIGMTTLKGAL